MSKDIVMCVDDPERLLGSDYFQRPLKFKIKIRKYQHSTLFCGENPEMSYLGDGIGQRDEGRNKQDPPDACFTI